ncbi:hypothetical protein KIPB_010182 [Kipferlia bialata]|uniref:FAD/NAD(P)-binding domain-containing protein n=1 Tax=Kipferlia bialata TaxID=797122 RepID=A0A9K3D432_9EUKA|nr:hypothetical protein KIPB_010182 [Kipferlia bialata]|eukprot:g10182.t1
MVRAADKPEFEGTIVVLGAGPAGSMAAISAREESSKAKIIVIGVEPALPYNRTKLSHALHQEHLLHDNAAGLVLHDAEWYAERNIEIRLNSRVDVVDTYGKKITVTNLNDEETVEVKYDRVIFCTGANPWVPRGLIQMEDEGEEVSAKKVTNISFLRSLRDMLNLRASITTLTLPVHAVMVGGGVLSMEAMPSLLDSLPDGSTISILQGSDHVLSAQLNHEYSEHFVKNLNKHVAGKVNFVLNSRAQRILCEKDEHEEVRATGVVVKTHGVERTIEADLVIVAMGVRPFLPKFGGEGDEDLAPTLSRGTLVVNDHCQSVTSPSVFGAGDCCVIDSLPYAGTYSRALDTARVAGRNAAFFSLADKDIMSNMPSGPKALFGYQLRMWDTIMMSIGNTKPTDEDMIVSVPLPAGRAMCVFKKHKLTGAILIGHNRLEKQGMALVQAVRKQLSSETVMGLLK